MVLMIFIGGTHNCCHSEETTVFCFSQNGEGPRYAGWMGSRQKRGKENDRQKDMDSVRASETDQIPVANKKQIRIICYILY